MSSERPIGSVLVTMQGCRWSNRHRQSGIDSRISALDSLPEFFSLIIISICDPSDSGTAGKCAASNSARQKQSARPGCDVNRFAAQWCGVKRD